MSATQRLPFGLRVLVAASSGAGFQFVAIGQARLLDFEFSNSTRGPLLCFGLMISAVAVVIVLADEVHR